MMSAGEGEAALLGAAGARRAEKITAIVSRNDGAIGISDIEGKAAQGTEERVGKRASFKHRCGTDSGSEMQIRVSPCSSVGLSEFVKRT